MATSLKSLSKEVTDQWHPIKNGDLTPDQVTPMSNRIIWWKCDIAYDHEWQASVCNRFSGTGCPSCAGQQVSITNCLATLCPNVADQWHKTKNGDLTAKGVTARSGRKAWWKCDVAEDHEWQAIIANRTNGSGCPSCAGVQVSVTNSLLSQFSDVAAQWHKTKNGILKPDMVTARNNQMVWWKCEVADDHEWQAIISNRTAGSGCPSCYGRQVSVTNCLASLNSEVAAQWHPTRNGRLTAHDVTAGSHRKCWWQCIANPDHEWQATVLSRTYGTGCSLCSSPGFSDSLPGYLYLLQHNKKGLFKIGITNTEHARINLHKSNGWCVTDIWHFDEGWVARELECAVKKYVHSGSARSVRAGDFGSFDGYTECWYRDSMQVDDLSEVMKILGGPRIQ
jgi:hypothetical protein